LIGSAAVGTVGVVTTVIALNSGEEQTKTTSDSPKEISQNVNVTSPEQSKTEQPSKEENTYTAQPERPNSTVISKDIPFINPLVTPPVLEEKDNSQVEKKDNLKPEDKVIVTEGPKAGSVIKNDTKKTPDKKENAKEAEAPVKHPENTKEPVFADLEAKVTKFPTMFTPNGDRSNDTYFVTVENIHEFQLVIIDQNNREMFRTNNPQDEWNGTNMAGEEAPSGSYAAIVTGKQQNGKSFRDIQLFELRR
jgi:gliding motility-associated-like protein